MQGVGSFVHYMFLSVKRHFSHEIEQGNSGDYLWITYVKGKGSILLRVSANQAYRAVQRTNSARPIDGSQ